MAAGKGEDGSASRRDGKCGGLSRQEVGEELHGGDEVAPRGQHHEVDGVEVFFASETAAQVGAGIDGGQGLATTWANCIPQSIFATKCFSRPCLPCVPGPNRNKNRRSSIRPRRVKILRRPSTVKQHGGYECASDARFGRLTTTCPPVRALPTGPHVCLVSQRWKYWHSFPHSRPRRNTWPPVGSSVHQRQLVYLNHRHYPST